MMRRLTCILIVTCLLIGESLAKDDCQDLLGDDSEDRRSVRRNRPRLYRREDVDHELHKEVEHILPDTAEEEHCRFDLNHLDPHKKDLIQQLQTAGYQLCLGCDHHDDTHHCNFIQVCDDDAVCINGTYANTAQVASLGVHSEPWYGCCEKDEDNENCDSDTEHLSLHGSVHVDYRFETCSGLLCNAGSQQSQLLRGFNKTFRDGHHHSQFSDWSSWENWSHWSACDCANGLQKRTRKCHSGICIGSDMDFTICHDVSNCPVNGGWTQYSNWTACNVTCGGGTQSRNRSCAYPPPAHCVGPEYDHRPCNTHHCPVDGGWTNYTNWSACAVTCNGGNQTRNRSCTNPAPAYGGLDCVGSEREHRPCNTQSCPVDGGWTNYTSWSVCDVTCSGGNQTRNRSCANPAPAYGGKDCVGNKEEHRPCNTHSCPVDGGWSSYSNWFTCSVTCGNGTQERVRYCNNPPRSSGGRDCVGNAVESRSCYTSCSGYWLPWASMSGCQLIHGACLAFRLRNCSTGDVNDCVGKDNEMFTCSPIDCLSSTTSSHVSSPLLTTIKQRVSATTSNLAFSTGLQTSSTGLPLTTNSIIRYSSTTTTNPLIISSLQTKTISTVTTTKASVSTSTSLPSSAPTSATANKAGLTMSTFPKTNLSTKLSLVSTTKAANVSSKATTVLSVTSPNTTAAPLGTTTKKMVTIPPRTIRCAKCAGPPEACELAYYEDTCHPPYHYCINHVTNLATGDKLVERKCGNITQCYHDWYLGTSDDDKCRQLSSSAHLTYKFDCTFCCVTDGCNVDLKPQHSTLYSSV